MNVYIATSMANRAAALTLADQLRNAGHTVTSEWHDLAPPIGGEASLTRGQRAEIAQMNFAAIGSSEAMVFLDHPACRGALLEVGYAIGQCVVIGYGPVECRSLMAEPYVVWVESQREILESLRTLS